jgi:hypothetical protein
MQPSERASAQDADIQDSSVQDLWFHHYSNAYPRMEDAQYGGELMDEPPAERFLASLLGAEPASTQQLKVTS